MRTVLITLIGPERTSDLVVDADTNVEALLPNLLVAGGVPEAARDETGWGVALMGKLLARGAAAARRASRALAARAWTAAAQARPRGDVAARPGRGAGTDRRCGRHGRSGEGRPLR
jgi:hypothetical protein